MVGSFQPGGISAGPEDHSDTKMLLKAYEERGVDHVRPFHGMFVYAVLKTETDRMRLALDRTIDRRLRRVFGRGVPEQ
jgi:hypothetical protein